MERTSREREYTIWVGRIGVGTSRSLPSARRRARRAAEEEARWTGTARWTVLDEQGRAVADGIVTA